MADSSNIGEICNGVDLRWTFGAHFECEYLQIRFFHQFQIFQLSMQMGYEFIFIHLSFYH